MHSIIYIYYEQIHSHEIVVVIVIDIVIDMDIFQVMGIVVNGSCGS